MALAQTLIPLLVFISPLHPLQTSLRQFSNDIICNIHRKGWVTFFLWMGVHGAVFLLANGLLGFLFQAQGPAVQRSSSGTERGPFQGSGFGLAFGV